MNSPHRAREAEIGELLARVGVRVAPLRWRSIGPIGSDIEAETSLGTYIMSFDAPITGGATNLWLAGDDVDTFSVHERQRDARAAAQADYEQRILSALQSMEASNV